MSLYVEFIMITFNVPACPRTLNDIKHSGETDSRRA